MCIVSYVGDHYNDYWKKKYPRIEPVIPKPFIPDDDWTQPWQPDPNTVPKPAKPYQPRPNPDRVPNIDELMKKLFPKKSGPTQEEFDELKREVEQMKELLKKAKEMDQALGTPDCELEQKVALLKLMAAAVGVDLEDIFGKKNEKEATQEKAAVPA